MKAKCTCKHEYQDKKHGQNIRVVTPKQVVQNRQPEYTCTVCGSKHTKLVD